MTRDDLLNMVHDRIGERAGVGFERFCKSVKDWDFIPVVANGELSAIIMTKEVDFHVVAIKPGKWATRKLFAETLGKSIKHHGYAQTVVMKDHKPGHELALRLGFIPVKETINSIVYRIERIRHV